MSSAVVECQGQAVALGCSKPGGTVQYIRLVSGIKQDGAPLTGRLARTDEVN